MKVEKKRIKGAVFSFFKFGKLNLKKVCITDEKLIIRIYLYLFILLFDIIPKIPAAKTKGLFPVESKKLFEKGEIPFVITSLEIRNEKIEVITIGFDFIINEITLAFFDVSLISWFIKISFPVFCITTLIIIYTGKEKCRSL